MTNPETTFVAYLIPIDDFVKEAGIELMEVGSTPEEAKTKLDASFDRFAKEFNEPYPDDPTPIEELMEGFFCHIKECK